MILAILIAAAINYPTATRAASINSFLEYQRCLSSEAVVADLSPSERTPRQAVTFALPRCAAKWQTFRAVFLPASPSPEDRALLVYYRGLAIGMAAGDVVEGRIGSCGSRPGKLQC